MSGFFGLLMIQAVVAIGQSGTAEPVSPLLEQPPAAVDVQAPEQLSSVPTADQTTAPQLSSEGRVVRSPVQLSDPDDRPSSSQVYRGARTAAPSEALSRPADGRTGAVAPVQGRDRCDPEARPASSSSMCANVIETRSEQFRRADPALLSPEQRLLVEQRTREGSSASAVRRIASGTVDPNSVEDQAIAAITLDNLASPPPPPAEPKKELPTGADSLINAIVNRIQPQN